MALEVAIPMGPVSRPGTPRAHTAPAKHLNITPKQECAWFAAIDSQSLNEVFRYFEDNAQALLRPDRLTRYFERENAFRTAQKNKKTGAELWREHQSTQSLLLSAVKTPPKTNPITQALFGFWLWTVAGHDFLQVSMPKDTFEEMNYQSAFFDDMKTLLRTDWMVQGLHLWLGELYKQVSQAKEPWKKKNKLPAIVTALRDYLPEVSFEKTPKATPGTYARVKNTPTGSQHTYYKMNVGQTPFRFWSVAAHGKKNTWRWISDIRGWEIACMARAICQSLQQKGPAPMWDMLQTVLNDRKTGFFDKSTFYDKLSKHLITWFQILLKDLREAEVECKRLKADSEAEQAAWQAKKETLEGELSLARESLRVYHEHASEADRKEIERLLKDNRGLKAEVLQTRRELDETRRDLASTQLILTELRAKEAHLEDKVQTETKRADKAEADAADAKKDLQKTKEERDEVIRRAELSETEVARLKDEKEKLRGDLQDAQKEEKKASTGQMISDALRGAQAHEMRELRRMGGSCPR